jgi:hypothetical protein
MPYLGVVGKGLSIVVFGIDVDGEEDEVAPSTACEAAFHACKVVRQAPAVVGIGYLE